MRLAIVTMMAAVVCGGQTVVNGGRDHKGALKASGTASTVDFVGAGSTAPVKTGTTAARPATCTIGQVYFSTDAAAGQNLSFCTSSNVWSAMTGGGGGGGGSGSGISYCAPASASGTAYTCSPSPAVSSYAAGVTLAFVPDVNGAGGATTVNVSGLGVKSVKQADGATNPASTDLVAGRFYVLAYDGAAFRLGLNATNASNITSGTLASARLPLPAASAVGGVQSKAAAARQFLTAINTDGSVSAAQPASTDLSDTACAVTVGATPAMNATSCNGSPGSYHTFKLGPLAQNASPTFTNGLSGRTYVIQVYQGASTAFTVTWPGNVAGGCPVSTTLNSRTQLVGVMDSAASSLLVQNCIYIDDLSTIIQGPTRTPPASPASGVLSCWFDSTANTELCKDSSGNVYAAVKTASGATTNQWVTHVDGNGVTQKAQPAFTNLSGSLTGSQLPALSGDVSNSGAAVTVTKVNGTSVAANSTADQALMTTAAATGAWTSVPNCGDSSHALAYNTSTHTFGCQNITAAAGSTSLDAVTAAGGANSINSADHAQAWKWTLTTSGKTGFRLSENTSGTATGSAVLIGVDTLSGSTVNPFQVTAGGTANGVRVDTAGKLAKTGAGKVEADSYAASSVNSAAMAVVNTRRVCIMENDTQSATVLTTAQITGRCDVPAASTVREIRIRADAGTPSALIEKWHCSGFTSGTCTGWTKTDLLSATLPAATGGFNACAMSSTAQTCIDGTTSHATITVSTTALAAGDIINIKSAAITGSPTWVHVEVIYTLD